MWLIRKHTNLSLREIGEIFGGRDHSTVIHSIEAVDYCPIHDSRFSWVSNYRKQNNPAPIEEDFELLEVCG